MVTEGGVDENGRRACFLPSAVVSALFRGKFLHELRGLQQRGEINYPPDLNPTLLSNLMNKLGRKNWRIRLMERYAHGNGVATYLARYVRGYGPYAPTARDTLNRVRQHFQ